MRLMMLTAVMLGTLATGSTASAQTAAVDARWLPWTGCWRPSGLPSPMDLDVGVDRIRVCVVPKDDGSARFLTLDGQRVVEDEAIVPDGPGQTIDQLTCHGARRSEWSGDGQRLYSSADLTCDKQSPRTMSGLSLMTPDAEWIDVQVIAGDAREQVRVRRYRRTTEQPSDPSLIPADLAARASSAARGSTLTVADIVDASHNVGPRVLEALLFETRTVFPLNARQLVAMDDAGVSDSVIDLMVAFTFPKKFEVKRAHSSGSGFAPLDFGVDDAWSFLGGPLYAIDSPFAFSRYGYYESDYGYGYGSSGSVTVVTPSEPHGRVVNGSGYTQVVARPTEASPRNGGSGGSGGDASSSSGGSNASSASSAGYSGGGGGDSGRTAVPR